MGALRTFACVWLSLLGCGRLNFQSTDAAAEASEDATDEDANMDAAADAAREATLADAMPTDAIADVDGTIDAEVPVDPLAVFSNVQEMPGARLNGDDPTLTGDMLEIVIEGANQDLYSATRASASDPWPTPTLVTELNSTAWESTPEMTYDGLTIYFSSDRSGERLVYRSTRSDRLATWSAPEVVAELQSAGIVGSDCAAVPLANGEGLLLVGKGEPSRGQDLSLFERNAGLWQQQRVLDEINSTSSESGGFLSGPNVLYFHSTRGGGDETLYRAVRPDTDSPFSTPEIVTELELPLRQLDPWLSPDARTIVFVSTQAGDGIRIYQATR